ncbi:helix-turn-helix transcriptional regulator [Rhodoblastus sp.]|uniref:helix-turn-helix transcriptional regulator n=1 Tax=Rhodoblastus sp. TaxID=1962975 RepID=UPI003F9D4B16
MPFSLAHFDAALRREQTVKGAVDLFLDFLRPYDVDTLAAGEIDVADKDMVVFFAIAWPDAWTQFYIRNRLHEHDPVLANVDVYRAPFTWNDLRRDGRFKGLTHEAFDRAHEFGWVDGLVAPFPRGGGRYGLVSVAARREIFSQEAKGLVALMAAAFHQHVRTLAATEGFPRPPAGLTERERQCLRLIAHGLSDKAIAHELGIGEATARGYFEGARRKLKAHTRPETIAKAVSWGVISD